MKAPGKLIVFEGADGTGKTTIASDFAQLLKDGGRKVLQQSFPGTEPGTIGNLVYSIHHAPVSAGIGEVTPSCLQALHMAAHLDLIENKILPALEAGEWVVLDRYWWSTKVYGAVRGVSEKFLSHLIEAEKCIWGGRSPDAVFCLTRSEPFDEIHDLEWQNVARRYRDTVLEESQHYPVFEISNEGITRDTVQLVLSHLGLST